MTVYEADVPGVGKKFELELGGGQRLIVILHHGGEREIYRRPRPDADSEKLLSLTAKQARQLGSILEGAFFQPVALEDVQVPLGEDIIQWVEVGHDSPLVGHTLAEADVRRRTGVSVIAIQRGEETIENPDATTAMEAGDVLVVIGDRSNLADLSDLRAGAMDETGDPDAR